MTAGSYTFDPCSIDGSNEVTLDNWKPTHTRPKLVPSKWRAAQNGDNSNQDPGIDDLKKIAMHLKNRCPDADIMKMFAITAETLVAIKRNCYSPVEGISLDNQSKIYKEFAKIEKKLLKIKDAMDFAADNLIKDKMVRKQFKTLSRMAYPKKRIDDSDEEEQHGKRRNKRSVE